MAHTDTQVNFTSAALYGVTHICEVLLEDSSI